MLRRLARSAALTGLAGSVGLAVVLATAGPALAKGATQARITGPGLSHAIVVSDAGEPGQDGDLATLAQQSQLFTVLFGENTEAPATSVASPPSKATLGSRYAVVYTVPGVDPKPGDKYGRIRQDLYPYARGGPLTYTPEGQHGFGQDLQTSGWLRADDGLVRTLTRLGVPSESNAEAVQRRAVPSHAASATRDRSGVPAWPIGVAAVLGAAVFTGTGLWLHHRRSSQV